MRGMLLAAAVQLALLFLFGSMPVAVSSASIVEFGAIPNNESYEVAIANGKAVYLAFLAANSSATVTNRVVTVPSGQTFTIIPYAIISNVVNIVFSLEGTLNAWPGDIFLWTNRSMDGRAMAVITILSSSNLTLTGGGVIQGNGYRWWWFVLLTGDDNRPHLVEMEMCTNVLFERWTLLNSPMYHVKYVDMLDAVVRQVTVHVDVTAQKQLLRSFGKLTEFELPTFPLNTDGIDVRGRNIHVTECSVTNFDDALCVKPLTKMNIISQCSENILIDKSNITWGVGATIGSVGPNTEVACVRNVVFRDIHFQHPLKAIYVKPNPGNSGTGIIDNITYENIVAETPLWWAIWVSTQQQAQPGGGANTHCSFFYPLPNTTCPTQPRVPVTRLYLRNVLMNNPLLSPGVLRCDPAGPCTGWEWTNVSMPSVFNWPMGPHFLCQAVVNASWTNVGPTCVDQPPSMPHDMSAEDRRRFAALEHAEHMYSAHDV